MNLLFVLFGSETTDPPIDVMSTPLSILCEYETLITSMVFAEPANWHRRPLAVLKMLPASATSLYPTILNVTEPLTRSPADAVSERPVANAERPTLTGLHSGVWPEAVPSVISV